MKNYETPELIELGGFSLLTQGNHGSFNDSSNSAGGGAGMADLDTPPGGGGGNGNNNT